MNEKEKQAEWVRYHKVAVLKLNSLLSCYEVDGQKMLQAVLRELKLERSEDLIKLISDERL